MMILSLKNIHLTRERSSILAGVSLDVELGSFFVLMGPTGCGKTTLLRIAGLLDVPDSGEVLFRGASVPRKGRERLGVRRKMATMFQDPVMFKGTVFSNIAWGLRIRGCSQRETALRVGEVLELVGLEGFEERDASTLSGGETRRTALARALVLDPELLILDEPTTSLHQSFKRELLGRIKEIHDRTDMTFLMATHDFTDALAVGDTGAVMRDGNIEQSGSMDKILFSPRNRFMASFTGMRNILPAEFCASEALVRDLSIRHTEEKSGHGFLAVPPEVIVISTAPTVTSERNRFIGIVRSITRNGTTWDVELDISGILLTAAVTTGALDELGVSPGSQVHVSFKASAVHVF